MCLQADPGKNYLKTWPVQRMLKESQGGFRQERSTLHQVYYLMELMESQDVSQVFLDFKAAYDIVDRRILWTSLYSRFGLPVPLTRFLRSLMDQNFSKLLIGGTKSARIFQLRGLPQGSSLSPTLFNFYIDSLIVLLEANRVKCNTFGLNSNNLFFADNGAVHAPELSAQLKSLQTDFSKLSLNNYYQPLYDDNSQQITKFF